jgi:hypothetical protein
MVAMTSVRNQKQEGDEREGCVAEENGAAAQVRYPCCLPSHCSWAPSPPSQLPNVHASHCDEWF